jgi:hypothetical protein
MRPSAWPPCAVELQHPAVACSRLERAGTGSSPLCSTRPVRRPPNIPPLPETFQHYRRELGAQVYGAMGIAIEDMKGHDAAVLHNWEFFRAPRPRRA